MARQVLVKSGIPVEKTAQTVNMVCGSGLRAVAAAAQAVKAGDAAAVIAGGVESMSQAPYILRQARTGYRMGDGSLVDSMISDGLWDIFNDYHMGITAENIAVKYGISRADQDAFAALSQNRTERAQAEGRFDDEIVPVAVPQRKGEPVPFDRDEFPRAGVTPESLAKLKGAFRSEGTVTAGNASGINDGAAALLVLDEDSLGAGADWSRWRASRPTPGAASTPRSWAWAPSRPYVSRWDAPAGGSTMSTSSRPTKPSPLRRSPSPGSSVSTWRGSM